MENKAYPSKPSFDKVDGERNPIQGYFEEIQTADYFPSISS